MIAADIFTRLRSLVRTHAFHLAAIVAVGFAGSTLLLFAFIFWQTTTIETMRVDQTLEREAVILAKETPHAAELMIEERLAADLHRLAIAALFDKAGQKVVGNIERIPQDLPLDGQAHRLGPGRPCCARSDIGTGRIVALRFSDGRTLVIGRSIDGLEDFRVVIMRALRLGMIPAAILALLIATIFGYRAQRHMAAVHGAAERILRGNFQERLPARGAGDDFDRLVNSVNRMLDEVGLVIDAVKDTGQHIAHDLRTPLTRVRLRLEQAYHQASSYEELRGMVDRAIDGLDLTLRIITGLLRIGQIDSGHARHLFRSFDIGGAVREVGNLYLPLAEEKQVAFTVDAADVPPIYGDRDLLVEAIINIVDNAIKFTPSGGAVRLEAGIDGEEVFVRVTDDGPGIAPEEREAVMRRRYRSDRTSAADGYGLGLSLVDAIARLHGFRVVIRNATVGCIVELICPAAETAGGRDDRAGGMAREISRTAIAADPGAARAR